MIEYCDPGNADAEAFGVEDAMCVGKQMRRKKK